MTSLIFLLAVARSDDANLPESTSGLSSVQQVASARVLRKDKDAGCMQHWRRREASFQDVRKANIEYWAHHPNEPPTQKAWFDAFEPTYNCDSRERIGGVLRHVAIGDGPEFMCGVEQLPDDCLVYNVGSNNNIYFERSLKEVAPWCDIHTFDPTLQAEYKGYAFSSFHQLGIAGNAIAEKAAARNASHRALTLGEVREGLGHLGRRIDVLKIDCEGCEWSALLPVFSDMEAGKLYVGQLLVEVHLQNSLAYATLLDWFKRADAAGLRMFSKERNGWGCSGFKCVEFSFVNQQHACTEFAATHCPGANPSVVCAAP